MKNIIYLTLAINFLNASNLTVMRGSDGGVDFLHLSIDAKEDIVCKSSMDFSQKEKIVCNSKCFDKNIVVEKDFKYFSLNIDEQSNIILYPKYESFIVSRDKTLYSTKRFHNNSAKHVDILFFENKPPFISNKDAKDRLNFQIDFLTDNNSFIDVLNENLLPVDSSRDANKLSFIKNLYEKKDYKSLIRKADDEIGKNNIYVSDIQLLKIRALNELAGDSKQTEYGYSDLENSCDSYIDMFPSNKHISEVLYYKVLSLYKQGKYRLALPIVDRLKTNFKDDYFAQKAQILKAKNLSKRKKYRTSAYKILENLLYNTNNTKIALESAFELIGLNLKDRDFKNAGRFLDKILKYDKSYITKKRKRSYQYAKQFADLKSYQDAVKIAKILTKDGKDEELVKNLAFWQEKAGMKDLAYKNYKDYLKEYPDGRYVNFIKERMDIVLLDISDTNSSKKIGEIDKVMKKYPNDPIYKKALLQKLDLFIKNKQYSSILKLKDKIKDINATKYIDEASREIFNSYMAKDDCISAVDMVNRYKIRVNRQNLYKLAQCYYDLARYKDALELTQKYISSQKDDELKKWYILSIRSLVKLSNYGKAIEYYHDILKLQEMDNNLPVDVYHDIFNSYFKLKYIDKALDIVKKIEEKSPKNPKLLDIYYELVKYYKNEKINLSVRYYAKKLLELQKKLKVGIYSPSVDIIMIKALNNLQKYKEALKYFADAYLSKNITDIQKAQLLYLAGEISLKMKNIKQAREFFIKCGTEVKSDRWQKLCSESLKLIEE